MELIQFKTFGSNDSFVKWQEEEDITIINISPMMMGANANVDNSDEKQQSNIDMDLLVGCFVLYKEL